MHRRARKPGFTLVELVVVVVIVGVIASIAIPRISRGSAAAKNAVTAGDLHILRTALLHYAAEHNNEFPGPTGDRVAEQLTSYTNLLGAVSYTRSSDYPFGPYLHEIPPCPIGFHPGSATIAIDDTNSPPANAPASEAGWVYNPNTGEIRPNAAGWNELEATTEPLTTD